MTLEFTREHLDEILEDITYLQDETEALRYVIDTVPYDRATPGGVSVIDKLLLLDYLQQDYYRPVFNSAAGRGPGTLKTEPVEKVIDRFKPESESSLDILALLKRISKHRASLVNILEKIPLTEWEQQVVLNGKKETLFQFAKNLVYRDRQILREIASMVMDFQKEQETQRGLQNRTNSRNDEG